MSSAPYLCGTVIRVASNGGTSLGRPPSHHTKAAHAAGNCNQWQSTSSRGVGQVATGLIAHFEGGNRPRSATGIELLCAEVLIPN